MIKDRESWPLIIGSFTVILSIFLLILSYSQFQVTHDEITQFTPNETKYTPDAINSFSIKITNPLDGSRVQNNIRIEGVLLGKSTEGQYMWVVVSPKSLPGQWWPQGSPIVPENGKWSENAVIGLPGEIGDGFDIAVISVNEGDNNKLLDWINSGKNTGRYPGITLPDSAKIMDLVAVVRQ